MRRVAVVAMVALVAIVALTACTPAQLEQWQLWHSLDPDAALEYANRPEVQQQLAGAADVLKSRSGAGISLGPCSPL